MARVAAQYAYMVSSDFESPEARYALGPYTPVDPQGVVCVCDVMKPTACTWETVTEKEQERSTITAGFYAHKNTLPA